MSAPKKTKKTEETFSPVLRLDFQRHVCFEVERRGKESRCITISSCGLEMAWERTDKILKDYYDLSKESLTKSVAGFLLVNARAFLNNGDAVAKLMEVYHMTQLGSAPKDATLQQLTEHYNKLAEPLGRGAVKSFKSKKEALERIERLEKELAAPSAEQKSNQNAQREAAAKRLAPLRESSEDGEVSTTTAGKTGTTKEAKMAEKKTAKKPAAKKAPAKKAPAKKAAPKKAAAKKDAEKKPRGQGIGAYCEELILKGKSNAEVAEAAQKKFGSATSASSVAWYRNKLKNEGKL